MSSDTIITGIISIGLALLTTAASVIGWVSKINSRVKVNEKSINLIEDSHEAMEKDLQNMKTSNAVQENKIDNILVILNEIKSKFDK